jgi:hypothetical protein
MIFVRTKNIFNKQINNMVNELHLKDSFKKSQNIIVRSPQL